ncbi:MAG: DUF4251 domain-containing protein [Paludibacter sp.]|nr:DUF4251 domain-containing protein [Paludibacter sp.]
MKAKLVYLEWIGLFFIVSCTTAKIPLETINEVTQRIQKKDFTIDVKYANPTKGSQIYLTSEYDLRVKNDSAFAYLPYFGVAYSAPYNSSEGGIKFSEPMYDYVSVPNKKKDGWNIRFKVRSKISEITILLEVFNNGSSSFTVSSYERDAIRFNGEMKFDSTK